ncbi:hypothetical protein CHS0354_043131 [Potamilus streckersoni]|uniref:Uncharacterized protein n=1 Tax=Potamilus streckersoni TaxID=2493646 RepID=A0AAE0VT05_9BIVA|nr:hypothetical protein CHS0354_043131 [Potamilus streckersoni]
MASNGLDHQENLTKVLGTMISLNADKEIAKYCREKDLNTEESIIKLMNLARYIEQKAKDYYIKCADCLIAHDRPLLRSTPGRKGPRNDKEDMIIAQPESEDCNSRLRDSGISSGIITEETTAE